MFVICMLNYFLQTVPLGGPEPTEGRTIVWLTYASFWETGPRTNERNVLETSLMDGKITHYSERERERE